MPWVNGAHVAEKRPMTGRPGNVMEFVELLLTMHLSLSLFLQVGPACRNANF